MRQVLTQAEALSASYRASAQIQGMRVDGLAHEAAHLRHILHVQQQTVSWRVTAPLRVVRHLMKGQLPTGQKIPVVYRRVREVYQDEGVKGVTQRLQARLPQTKLGRMVGRLTPDRKKPSSGAAASARPSTLQTHEVKLRPVTAEERQKTLEVIYTQSLGETRGQLAPRFLIIAELSLRQCAKYRVWQKEEQLRSLGWAVDVVDWREAEQALSALQTCTEVIFYRVPAFESVENLLQETRRLGLSPWWEVDDLIFSAELYQENGNLQTLDKAEQNQLLFGVRLFRKCLLSCDRAIASTRVLAQAMRDAGIPSAVVIENALDQQTIDIARSLAEYGVPAHDTTQEIRIVYGSGTKTHDADFRVAAKGILAAMQTDPRLTLCIIGDLTLPESFEAVKDRVQTLAGRDYAAYLGLLAQADMTIAPLEPTVFNDAKSNIKFLEAAILKVPAVCSPRDAFLQVMRDEENGLLAEQDTQWRDAILRLAEDAALRARLGQQAYEDVLGRYSPEQITQQQVLPVFGRPVENRSKTNLHVLCVNVYFSPRSFGGATFVAEEMVRRLQRLPDVDVSVMTSRPELHNRGKASVRYSVGGCSVLGVRVPPDHDRVGGIDNEAATSHFRKWLSAMQPDVVHFHATQGMGLGLLRACIEAGVPYIITLHDAWWLCERQFMVKADGHYCFQETINLRICQMCVPEARHLADRAVMMRAALEGAALLLSPSETHRQLFIANGVSPERIIVNKNGFIWPLVPRTPRQSGSPLRFGYVGGTENIKGYPLVRRAFQALSESNWELRVVDNKLNLGIRSVYTESWKVKGTVTTVPAYSPETMETFFDGIDVLLFPSQWKESYGLTVREALARDIWVISTAPGGQSEDIVDGVNGTLIAMDGQADGLQKAIEALLRNPEKLTGYVNPLKHTLATFEEQTAELDGVLRDVVAKETANARRLATDLSAISADPTA
ncbi:glycosyl transferase [Acetobacter orleanensis]|nr:glycosyl transferase [Acetobacter orleanensis]